MPNVSLVSPKVLTWDWRVVWPGMSGAAQYFPTAPSFAFNGGSTELQPSPYAANGASGSAPTYVLGGGVGPGFNFALVNGRVCCTATGNPSYFYFGYPWWLPAYDAAGANPGSYMSTGSQVAVFDCHFSLPTNLAVYTPDTTGWWWATRAGATLGNNQVPGGGTPSGGWGFAFNDDGGGNVQVELLAWHGASIDARIPAPAGSIPDVTLWSSARFVVVSAYAGVPAHLYAYMNGTPWWSQDFDDVTLFRPGTLNAGQPTFYQMLARAGAAQAHYVQIESRFGRTTPDGIPAQQE